jgi:formylglycine-generating enzyme required for sulfatase activity
MKDKDARIAEVLDGYLRALKSGDAPTREALLASHEDIADELAGALYGLDFVHHAGPDLSGADDPLLGKALGDYRLLREIGRGGMAVVYEAEQVSLGRRVALKVLPFAAVLDPRQLQRFKNEALAAAHLNHPHIVPVYAVGCERGVHYYAMQFVEGQSLALAIREMKVERVAREPEGPRTPISSHGSNREPAYIRMAASLGMQAAEALDHAHHLGVVHRDVTPGNLLVDVSGTLWVTDFGLASSMADVSLTMTGEILGTIRYMSPEQALGKRVPLDHRTDIYSLGATLYELFTLQPAFPGDDPHLVIRDIAFRDPVPARRLNPALPADLETVIQKAMTKDPAGRYASAQEMADDFRRFLDDKPVLARRPSLAARAAKWSRRHRRLVAVAGALAVTAVVALAAGTALLAREQRNTRAALAEILRLADTKRVRDLLREEERLWPIHPDRRADMASWMGEARDVLRNRADHEAALAHLRRGALSRVPKASALLEDADGIDAAVREDWVWIFERKEDEWRHGVLEGLVADLAKLKGALLEMEGRHEAAASLRARSIDAHDAAWSAAVEAVAASPRYGGLRLAPQVGLVPLGPDPESHLFEFAHVGSGSVPSRDPGTKRLLLAEDAGIVLVLIPGGTFRMGAQRFDPAAPNYDAEASDEESPVHEVKLSPYFIAKHECTQGQWELITGGGLPSRFAHGSEVAGKPVTRRNPVECVSWDDCARWLPRYGLELPTEAQWEFACRAGTETPWFFGAGTAAAARVANLADASCMSFRESAWLSSSGPRSGFVADRMYDDGFPIHAPVGSFAPNAFGLLDICGNVHEWCRDTQGDWEDKVLHGWRYDTDAAQDPVIEGFGYHTIRGGSWRSALTHARSTCRNGFQPVFQSSALGVRASRSVSQR